MISAIVTDIEGTTSSLSFVHDVLFPFARERLADFVRRSANDTAVRQRLDEVRQMAGASLSNDAVVTQLLRWIDEDQKITPLKALQGMIWEQGYKNGDFKGHVYEDAARRLRQWHTAGIRLYVYSSGSVAAQQLLFAHTVYGDLTPLFSGYFDTTTGGKRELTSYRKIAESTHTATSAMLFLSDIREELDAARAAGMKTGWLVRANTVDPQAAHPQIRSFDEIAL
ncbi:MAG: acireductone synthase [Sulfuricaulis sp.]